MSYLNNPQNTISKTPLNTKTPFKWVFMDTIPAISSKILTKYTTFSNYLLTVDVYYRLTRFYGIENISTEELMDNIDIFQDIFGK